MKINEVILEVENDTLILVDLEMKLHQNHKLSLVIHVFYCFLGTLIMAANGFVTFFILKQKCRTFLDNLIIVDCWYSSMKELVLFQIHKN